MPSIFLNRCPGCSAEVELGCRFCPVCGARLETPATVPAPPPAPPPGDGEPYVPGTILAKRYRIVGIIGKGGMGEIYRADDMRLGQPVALKFLPRFLARHQTMRERFHAEVRLARQVSHPNVCTVYDIGEVDGRPFLSMEYVDGEDLASLLRRIGRLERGKAVEIARQICAGLATAHAQGILHRDLKPANIMLNGHGNVRITDFGLASLITERVDRDAVVGTPAYMPPELIEGGPVTTRSDVYSLGLVLYELFTGHVAFEGESFEEYAHHQKRTPPPPPSLVVEGFDPDVEQVILSCLEKDPERRPPSVTAVAAALPGSDPLQAVVAAGKTPSPAMVAAAGDVGAIRPATGIACAAVAAVGLLAAFLFADRTQAVHRTPLAKSCDFLVDRSREVLRALGWTVEPADFAYGFTYDGDALRHLYVDGGERRQSPADGGASASPGALPSHARFWFRQSPDDMTWPMPTHGLISSGKVAFDGPPRDRPGMASVVLDPTSGRLVRLDVVPNRDPDPAQTMDGSGSVAAGTPAIEGSSIEPDWSEVLELAGFDPSRFDETDPITRPERFADRRRAWVGPHPSVPDATLRLEAASLGGRVVSFQARDPWTRGSSVGARYLSEISRPLVRVEMRVAGVAWLAILCGMIFMARRNLRAGRGDRKGAFRLAVAAGLLIFARWILVGHHVAAGRLEVIVLSSALAWSLLAAGAMWVLYVALEPAVRRTWPETIISWSRLLAGRFRDPLVGRDVLLGAVFGVLFVLLINLRLLVPGWLGRPEPMPILGELEVLLGTRYLLGWLSGAVLASLFEAFTVMFLFVLVRVVLRNRWLASSVVLALFAFTSPFVRGVFDPIGIVAGLTSAALLMVVLFRFGLLATLSAFFVFALLVQFPVSTAFSAWHGGASAFALLVVVGLTVASLVVAVGRRVLTPSLQ